jgi:hypothetical protein
MGSGDPATTPDIRADPGPAATLHAPNVIHLTILDLYRWNTYYLYWTENGGPRSERRLDGSSQPNGTVTYDFPADSGGQYEFWVQGCPVSVLGPDQRCSDMSRPATATAATNDTSLAQFLQRSGRAASVRLRSLAPPFSLRDLLNGE